MILNKRLILSVLLFICFQFTGCSKENNEYVPSIEPIPTQAITASYNKLKIHYIDVGQGDSTFIELPNGECMLIDAGNYGDDDIIKSVINKAGYLKLDYVVATHPHSDHIGSMADIIRYYKIGKIYMPGKAHTTKAFENLLDAIEEEGLNIDLAKAGVNILNSENLKIDILSPISKNYEDLNDYSAVVKIRHGINTFLFMGDAENKVEQELLKTKTDVTADVLKVGHHGSSSSSGYEFIKVVSPKYAVISCGKDNGYGHPHSEVLDILRENNIRVYRTDEAGTITVTSDGINIIIDKKASQIKENAPPKEINVGNSTVVYITKTGKRYHKNSCSSLKSSKIKSTIEEAKEKGLTPCQKCSPP